MPTVILPQYPSGEASLSQSACSLVAPGRLALLSCLFPCTAGDCDDRHMLCTYAPQANGKLDSLYAESVDGVLRIYLRKRKAMDEFTSP